MPNCFTLTKIGEDKPSIFATIDDDLRVYFNEEPDADRWLYSWYDIVGLALALGHSWEKMREYITDPGNLKVIDYLEKRYTINAWSQVGGRR